MLLIVHGGAGKKRPSKKALNKLCESISSGYEVLKNGGIAVNAVVGAITVLEDSGIFNAGAGGNLQLDEVRRLDASLMEGKDLKAGSVIGIKGIRNPIKVAKVILDMPHVMFTNIGARNIARVENLPELPKIDKGKLRKLKMTKKRTWTEIYEKYFSTVGAVAFDAYGNVAAGASTGGITMMLPGRVGDTPIIGAGVYADNYSGAVSCTGIGEHIIRLALAKEICMNVKKMSPRRAARLSLKRVIEINGSAGVIVINNKGQFAIMHTTKYMASGYINKKGIVIKEKFSKVEI